MRPDAFDLIPEFMQFFQIDFPAVTICPGLWLELEDKLINKTHESGEIFTDEDTYADFLGILEAIEQNLEKLDDKKLKKMYENLII